MLKNKVAIVTGSTQGIGLAIAKMLAQNGSFVFINSRNEESVKNIVDKYKQEGLIVDGYTADVSEEDSVKELIKTVYKKAGRIDIIVNNAGIAEARNCPLQNITIELWDQYMNSSLKSAFLMCREVVPFMEKQKSGKIINIVSNACFHGLASAHYISSKSGIIGLTRSLVRELGPSNIQINAVSPGLTNTPTARKNHKMWTFENTIQKTPLGRIAQPDDIAKAVLFFASPLSDFITGQVLNVDGGATFH